jgi:hypothetical protein
MGRLDPNSLVLPAAIIILATLAVISGYRLEISRDGLRFETNPTTVGEPIKTGAANFR